ncbi:MAG: hypothetical protein R6X34_03500 [Chloroflexota bacterium]
MSKFEWQTGEDDRWENDRAADRNPKPGKHKRPFPLILLLVAALLLAGWVLTRQVSQQVASATAAVQTDILAAHNLVQTADARRDVELLRSVLSGRLPEWTAAQEETVTAGILYGRQPWGLVSTAPNGVPFSLDDLAERVSLSLSPELNEAELQFPLAYTHTLVSGVQQTVVFTQTAVYRRGARSWLIASPLPEFWGRWVTNRGDRLTLIYPQRDADLAERLAADLEALLAEVCADPTLPDCPDDFNVAVRLDTHPQSLVDSIDKRSLFSNTPYLQLPSPSLFGLPQDDAAYDALFRAYAAPVVTAVFADLFDWECCHHAPMFQVLTEYQLKQMGILPWPVTDEYHTRALRENVSLEDLFPMWRAQKFLNSQEEGWFLYAAFDFLLNQYPTLSISQLLPSIGEQNNLSLWLTNALNREGYQIGSGEVGLANLDREWWHFAYTQTLLAQENQPLPLPLPEQDAILLCMSDVNFDQSSNMSLVRYNPSDESVTDLLTTQGVILFNPLQADNGLILQKIPLDGTENWRTEIWRFADSDTSLQGDHYMSFFLGQFDPSGRYAVMFISEVEQALPQPHLLDLDSCNETTCDLSLLAGLPVWSPDGEKTIIENASITEFTTYLRNDMMMILDASIPPRVNKMWLGDSRGQLPGAAAEVPVIGEGFSPFWVDDDTFGYIRLAAGDIFEVVTRSLSREEVELVATTADLEALLPAGNRAPIKLRYVMTHPAQPDLLMMAALNEFAREVYVFSYNLETDELTLHLQSLIQPYHSLGFSPNGRFLVLTGVGDGEQGNARIIYVHDLDTFETQTYFSEYVRFGFSPLYDWSADGNWLLFQVDERVLSLTAPAYQYQMVQSHEQGYCTSMAWINR